MAEELQVTEEKVKYGKTMKEEFEKNLTLLPGESIDYAVMGLAKPKKGFFSGSQAIFAITNLRIVILLHKALGADKILCIPLTKIKRVSYTPQTATHFSGADIDYLDDSIRITPSSKFTGLTGSMQMAAKFNLSGNMTDNSLIVELFNSLDSKLPSGILDKSSLAK